MLLTYLNHSNPKELIDSVKVILTSAIQESRTPQQLMLGLGGLMKDTTHKPILSILVSNWLEMMIPGSYGCSLCLLTATAI